MFNWFKILWNLSDEKLVEINGIDYTLYLVFLRYCAIFFAGLTIFNLIFMVPVYITGKPRFNADGTSTVNSTMDKITVLNITDRSGKLAFTYFASLLIVSSALLITLQRYRLKYESWKRQRDPAIEFRTDADVAHYTIMVSNLPTNVQTDLLQKRISTAMSTVFNSNEEKCFVKVRVLGDYDHLYEMCVKLKRNIEKLRVVKEVHLASGPG